MSGQADGGLEALLDLDGYVLVLDESGNYWIKFIVKRVPASPAKPHGLDYSLTLHGPRGERLVGFDNAHSAARTRRGEPQDHKHRFEKAFPYSYLDAVSLLEAFWTEVDAVLKKRGLREDA